MGREKDALLHRAARSRGGVLTRRQLTDKIGYSRQAVRRLERAGIIVAVHRPVLRLASYPETPELLVNAAVAAVGEGAVASHKTAAARWGLGDVKLVPPFHVSSPTRCQARYDDVVSHHVTTLGRLDRTVLGRTPITSSARTVVDCADPDDPETTEDILLDAVRTLGTRYAAILEVLERVPNARGGALLRRLLARHDRATVARLLSHLERRYLALFRRAGLPPPQVNAKIFGVDGAIVAKLDFVWPEYGVVVEVDGLRYHSTRRQKEYDDRRQNAIVLTGRTVLRYSARDLDEPDRIVGEIRRAFSMAGSMPAEAAD
jgi:predicted transcriptional regulator of viral defense system